MHTFLTYFVVQSLAVSILLIQFLANLSLLESFFIFSMILNNKNIFPIFKIIHKNGPPGKLHRTHKRMCCFWGKKQQAAGKSFPKSGIKVAQADDYSQTAHSPVEWMCCCQHQSPLLASHFHPGGPSSFLWTYFCIFTMEK